MVAADGKLYMVGGIHRKITDEVIVSANAGSTWTHVAQ
jgi:hypothetical protein